MSRSKAKEGSWDYLECPQFPGIAVWQKVNAGSHRTCTFNLWELNSEFIHVIVGGKGKEREGKRKEKQRGEERQMKE